MASQGFEEYQRQLYADIIDTLKDFSAYGAAIRNGELTEQSNPKLMEEIMKKARPIFIKNHFLRLNPVPDPVARTRIHSTDKAMGALVRDTEKEDVPFLMNAITIPVLFLGGKYDFVPPDDYETSRKLMKNAPDVTIIITPNGSHRSMWDDSHNYFLGIREFIGRINSSYR